MLCVCARVCVYVCLCSVCMGVCGYIHTLHTHGGQSKMSVATPPPIAVCLSAWSQGVTMFLGWLASRLSGSACSLSPVLKLQTHRATSRFFLHGSWGLKLRCSCLKKTDILMSMSGLFMSTHERIHPYP